METLSQIQTKQNAILMAFNQVESILAPIHTGIGKNDLLNFNHFNLERLAKNSNLISADAVKVNITTEQQRLHPDHPKYSAVPDFEWGAPTYDNGKVLIQIEGPDFGYSFAPQQICYIKGKLEKSFKSVESHTKKAAKQMKPAIQRSSLPELKAEIQRKEETARYLYGNKRGAWGVKTKADSKRSYEIEKLKSQARTIEAREKKTQTMQTKSALLKTDSKKFIKKSITLIPNDYICDMKEKGKYPVLINLVIKKKFFDQILSGEKKKEYRAPSKFNARLLGFKDDNGKYSPRKDITHIRFVNGYKDNSPWLVAECKEVGCYTFVNEIPEGLKKGDIALEIILGAVVEHS